MAPGAQWIQINARYQRMSTLVVAVPGERVTPARSFASGERRRDWAGSALKRDPRLEDWRRICRQRYRQSAQRRRVQCRPDRTCLRECHRRIGFAQVENGKTGDDIADNCQIIADENAVYDIAEITVVLLKARRQRTRSDRKYRRYARCRENHPSRRGCPTRRGQLLVGSRFL